MIRNFQPIVSIGIPVYNGGSYLEHALKSILSQTYENMEIVISDNASIDSTQEICKTYEALDERINYYRNEYNLGAAPNYNRVFNLSTGKYFKWAAHDDLIAPMFIEKCVNILELYPEVILCYSKGIIIDKDGNYVNDYEPEPYLIGLNRVERFQKFMTTSYLNIQMSGLMRTEILKKVGKYGSYPAADEVLSAELSLYGEFYVIPERLFYVRLHPEQSTFGVFAQGGEKIKFSQRDRIQWFCTTNVNKIIYPTWEFLFDSIRAIRWAPIKSSERANCYAILMKRELRPDRLRALGKDILLAIGEFTKRLLKLLKGRQLTGA
jgi:glycosyltransferase involved in cell wall biosynthesis